MDLRVVALFTLVVAVAHSDIIVTSSDGDRVQCVDKFKQPAFNLTRLKNHKLQESPSTIPRIEAVKKKKRHTIEAYVSTAPCPEGTIPFRNDSIDLSGRTVAVNGTDYTPRHEYGIVSTTGTSTKLYGARGTVSVWDPATEADEMSISQIWISSGSYEANDVNTVEVGWQVLPKMYNDSRPRLFTYWTNNSYRHGCYNLQCSGFIQINNNIVIGGAISPVSSFGGSQSEISILVWKDHLNGNWWLCLGSANVLVGYWPAELFTSLSDHATVAEWGGEVLRFDRLSKTQMGSGRFSKDGFGKSSYFRNLETVDNNYSLQPVQDLSTIITNPDHYNVKSMHNNEWNTYIFYGGPGFTNSGAVGIELDFALFLVLIVLLV